VLPVAHVPAQRVLPHVFRQSQVHMRAGPPHGKQPPFRVRQGDREDAGRLQSQPDHLELQDTGGLVHRRDAFFRHRDRFVRHRCSPNQPTATVGDVDDVLLRINVVLRGLRQNREPRGPR
jgi:hypothetical protein